MRRHHPTPPRPIHVCTGNSREETPLFRAVQFGNMAWVQGLLERGANPRLTFVPNDRDEHHVDRYNSIYKLLDNYRGEALSTEREQRSKFRKGKKTTDVRRTCVRLVCAHLRSPVASRTYCSSTAICRSKRAKRCVPTLSRTPTRTPCSPSRSRRQRSPQCTHARLVLSDRLTARCSFGKFQSAAKQKDSWSMMQTVNINIDRVSLLKEETGQYFIGARQPIAPTYTVLTARRLRLEGERSIAGG